MKGHCSFLAVFALLALASILGTSAYDPSPLQDTCVAINDPKTGSMLSFSFLCLIFELMSQTKLKSTFELMLSLAC